MEGCRNRLTGEYFMGENVVQASFAIAMVSHILAPLEDKTARTGFVANSTVLQCKHYEKRD